MNLEEYIKLYKNGGYIKEMRKYVGHAPILTCACGVIIENEDGEILLQKRQDNGCWAIIGGSMEMGETFEETVRRETMEESGLTLLEGKTGSVWGCWNKNIPVEHNGEATRNSYLATAVVRIKDGKQYLYDIINIKKEASTPL